MFFRIKSTKTSKVLKLLESFRDCEGTPRHRTVVSLGTPKISKDKLKPIAYLIEKHFYNTPNDCVYDAELSQSDYKYADEIIRKIESENRWIPAKSLPKNVYDQKEVTQEKKDIIDHETNSELGPVLACKKAWDDLNFNKILKNQGFSDSRIQSSMISVINRVVDPVAENSLVQWFRSTALGDIIKDQLKGASSDRFYRVCDSLSKKHVKIEKSLRKETKKFHSLNSTILLYDLTNTHFEGSCLHNPDAKHGKNKQKRNDCPQIVVGMLFDQNGFEVGHKMFPGNQSDTKSLPSMIKQMKEIDNEDSKESLVVMDSGMASKDNLWQMRKASLKYLVNSKRPGRKKYEKYFNEKEKFKLVKNRHNKKPVYCRLIEEIKDEKNKDDTKKEKYHEKVLLCYSKERSQKENAIILKAEKKLIKELLKFQQKVYNQKKIVSQKDIDIKIGKLKNKHSRVQRFFDIEGVSKSRTFQWTIRQKELESLKVLSGCYVLRTNSEKINEHEIWQTYISLTKAEEGFKILKGNLGLRPNFHQKKERVNAHVFITILAYILLRHITWQLEKEGDFRNWESIRRVLKTHAYATMTYVDLKGDIHHIRKAGKPSEEQKNIYSILGIEWNKLPQNKYVISNK